MKKIVLIGPESTGKSTLATALAQHYQTVFVPEYARAYIEQLDRSYKQNDLLKIAKGQLKLETEILEKANRFLFCDTDLRVIKVWSEFKYKTCDQWIVEQIQQRQYDLYLLCGTDVPWEYDPQREHPHLRAELYGIYKKQLLNDGVNFIEVWGTLQERMEKIKAYFDAYFD